MNWLLNALDIAAAALNLAMWLAWLRRSRRTAKLNQLLADLCVRSFVLQHRGVWRAYAGTMGDITVDIGVRPKRAPGNEGEG